jgi:endoglucanase
LRCSRLPLRSAPLRGANLFVDGPAHGIAARAIEQLLHIDPTGFPDSYPWSKFQASLDHGPLASRLTGHPGLSKQVQELDKIAQEPETNRFSLYSGGGGPGAVLSQVQDFMCSRLTADPGSVPMISTFFLYQAGYCETTAEIVSHRATFERQIDELAQGIGRHPAILFLEEDAIGSSECMQKNGALGQWEQDIRYEIGKVAALPHVVAYIEAGSEDEASVPYTAAALRAVGVNRIAGFYTNDTHFNWTSSEIKWGDEVSAATGGAHFVINTGENGQGPLLNPDPATQGVEALCNPPGRGLGPKNTTDTGFAGVDGFLWTAVPGNSAGSCNGGPAPGTFWPARAIMLAENAQGKLGPGYPTDPY